MMKTQTDLESVPCIICGSRNADPILQSGLMQIVRCRHDGLLYVNPRHTGSRVKKIAESWMDEHVDLLPPRLPTLRREAAIVQKFKQSGALLDVGCATGQFFQFFPRSRWALFGVEPSHRAAALAHRQFGAEVRCASFDAAHWPAATFNAISILDALFCFADPLSALNLAHKLLNPGGILAVEIPGYRYKMLRERGPICWLLSRTWSRINPEGRQLYHFSSKAIRLLFRKTGFEVLDVSVQKAPQQGTQWATWLNSLHFGLAQSVRFASGGRLSIAAKELYICRKSG
jgi:SAM-dependent methyltransferase